MYAVCCEFTGCKMTISNQIFGDRHVIFSICRMFHFWVTAEALIAIMVSKISYMLQYGLTYTTQTLIHSYNANVQMYPDT